MRHLIVKSIKELKKLDGGFNPNTTRWSKRTKKHKRTEFFLNDVHFSEIDWDNIDCSDEELLTAFETIIRRMQTQM